MAKRNLTGAARGNVSVPQSHLTVYREALKETILAHPEGALRGPMFDGVRLFGLDESQFNALIDALVDQHWIEARIEGGLTVYYPCAMRKAGAQ